MTNFPNNFDDDTTLPFVNDNITETGGEAINALRDAVYAIQQYLGLGGDGTTGSMSARFGVSIFPDGTIKPSAITGLGLVTLPITENQIASNASIPESKLRLDHRTQDLFNYIRDLSGDINQTIGWISTTGIRLSPHLMGAIYRHTMDQVDVTVDTNTYPFLGNKFRQLRDNLQSYNLVKDINAELLAHQWADGSSFVSPTAVITNNGSQYPATYAHVSSGIFLNTDRFSTIPQTAQDVQAFAEFVDSSSIFLLGSRIQNLYSNGISRVSRSSSLNIDGYGAPIVPATPAIAYLKNLGNASAPFDDINTGDDIIEFKPTTLEQTSNSFDAKFALVKVGDIVRINYGTIEVSFIIKEKKYIQSEGNKKYIVRIAGKNLFYSTTAIARIDKPLFNINKYGVLAMAAANNNFSQPPSLIVASPRGGAALGVGFSPEQFDSTHYLLYLVLYPTGNPAESSINLPGIDVTGNGGTTPGLYTLDSIVEATNAAFRKAGSNNRFMAFSYNGDFGIMLADSYGNSSFSIVNAVMDDDGFYDETETNLNFSNNVVGIFAANGFPPDPLGFGARGANVASPPYQATYESAEASQNPTKLFVPLRRNNYYVNGIEKDRLTLEPDQALDGYGDGYWVGEIIDRQVFPGPGGRVQVTYRIPLDLSDSTLKIGKTIVVQSLGAGTSVDFGRFIIQSVAFGCDPSIFTDITVYDAVHAKGYSPTTTLDIDNNVAIYFNSDSVSFNNETSTDFTSATPFKRHFEVYVDQEANTFTHERSRFLAGGMSLTVNGNTLLSYSELAKLDIVKVAPKLRGYQFGPVTKITLKINSYSDTTGIYNGYLGSYDGVTFTKQGPLVYGKKGQVTRFYDETHIDYIDIIFDINNTVSSITNQYLDFQLFPTLSLDDEVMLIGTCQVNDVSKVVNRIRDERQFGNTSEKDLTTSAINLIASGDKALHVNGVIRGLDITGVDDEVISLRGGVVLTDGGLRSLNEQTFIVPKVRELFNNTSYPINWILCVNSLGELVTIPMIDYDSVLGTPNSSLRLFTIENVVIPGSTYVVDSTTFSDLINLRKDLTPLYIVSSTVTINTGPSYNVSLTYRDVRRFVNDQDSCIPAVVTNGNSQGNFRDLNTAINWLRFNNAFQSTLVLKAANTYSGAFDFTTGHLDISPGGSGASLAFSSTLNVSNFRFTDIPTTIGSTATLSSTVFNSSPLTISAGSGATLTNVTLNRSPLTVGATSGKTLLTTTDVLESTITVGSASGLETQGCPITNSIISVTGLAALGVFTTGGSDIWTTLTDSRLTAGSVTCATASFYRTHVVSTNNVSLTLGRWVDSNLTITAGTLATNATFFENSVITASSNAVLSGGSYANCTITIGGAGTLTGATFTNCTITATTASLISDCKFIDSSVSFTGAVAVSDTSFRGCTLVFTNGGSFTDVLINPSTVTIGATIDVSNTTIVDSLILASAVRAFSLSNNFKFNRNTVYWTGTASGGSYEPEHIVNSSNGFMYASVSNTIITDITVEENIFNYSMTDRFPFFSLQLTSYSSVVKNVSVSRNKFTSASVSEDVRAVIAVVSTLTTRAALGVFPQFPVLVDVHFDDNACNYNQLIIITGTKDTGIGLMNGANPLAINTTISRNICGTIGFFIGSAGPFDGINVGSPNNGIIRDKVNKLVIDGNYCKFIGNLDHRGDYICFRATRFPFANVAEEVASTPGDCLISNNTCNWIQIGVGGYTIGPSTAEILNNNVSPSNKIFLNYYTSQTTYQTITPGNVGILVRRPHNATDLAAASVISGNNLVQKNTTTASPGATITGATNAGPIVITTSAAHGFATDQLVSISGVLGNTAANGNWTIIVTGANTFSLTGSTGNGAYTSGGIAVSTNVYYYDAGIATFNNARITNNRISGVINSDDAPLIYLWDVFKSAIISDNILERKGLECKAYIWFDRFGAGLNHAVTILVAGNVLDNVKFTTGNPDRAFLSYTTYNSGFANGVVLKDNFVQISSTTYEFRYGGNGKSAVLSVP